LLGFVSTWAIEEPDPALAPVMPPVTAPIVQVNVLGILDVSIMLGLPPLQVVAVVELVIIGFGTTVTLMV